MTAPLAARRPMPSHTLDIKGGSKRDSEGARSALRVALVGHEDGAGPAAPASAFVLETVRAEAPDPPPVEARRRTEWPPRGRPGTGTSNMMMGKDCLDLQECQTPGA